MTFGSRGSLRPPFEEILNSRFWPQGVMRPKADIVGAGD